MSLDAWITVAVVLSCLSTLMLTRLGPDLVFVAGLTLLLALGIVDTKEAFSGFANTGMLTVAVMYIIAAGLRETGALHAIVTHLFGRPQTVARAQWRMMLPVTFMSAFLNNTPVVATFLPAVLDWAKRQRISISKLAMPLSFAAILGGMCTLIGTSTNLVVHGMLLETADTRGFTFFELAWVGVPCALLGMAYIVLASRWLLPERIAATQQFENAREYTVEMLVDATGPLAGQTIEQAGLRHLPGLYLIEIDRDGQTIPAAGPTEQLLAGDRLIFAGITSSIADLQKIRGLTPATNQVFKLDAPRPQRAMIEAVVSRDCPAVGKTIRASNFRNIYKAVVIAVARDGRRLPGKLGDIRVQTGDMLLLETDPGFAQRYGNARDFLLLHPVEGARVPRFERGGIAWLILAGVVVSATAGWLDMLTAALLGAGLMLLSRCLTATMARRSIDLEVLLVIAASLGLGTALEHTGAAAALAGSLVGSVGDHPWLILAAVYLATLLITEIVTNNAAAVLMFPVAHAAAANLGLEFMPLAVAIAMAASAGFATPIGYQTNLIVYGPGGYRFGDYLRFGLPLNLLLMCVALVIIPLVWPLQG